MAKFKVGDLVYFGEDHSTVLVVKQIDDGDPHLPYFVEDRETGEPTWASENILTAVPQLPDDNPKSALGALKPGFTSIPPVAILELGGAMDDGARKYGQMNWREKGVAVSVYINAILRHVLSFADGEDVASDSGRHHLAHVMANCAIVLDALSLGVLKDDRPVKGEFPRLVQEYTKKAA